jgi:hypothetical protein
MCFRHFPFLAPYFNCDLKIYCASTISQGTTVSPWIVTLDALKPFMCDAPKQVRKHSLRFIVGIIS